jgi:MGT family glycosyltransferase
MAKNILIIAAPFEGHIAGLKEIIKDLLALGHNVTCYLLDKFENRFKGIDIKLKTFDIGIIKPPPRAPEMAIRGMTFAKAYEEILSLAIKSNEKYDYLIFDSILDGYEMNKIFKVPNLISLYTFPIVEIIPMSKVNAGKRVGFLAPVNKKFNVNLRDFMDIVYDKNAKYKLVLTSKLFQPETKVIDDSYYFLGPSFDERPEDTSFTFKKDEKKKLIYISFGTVYTQKPIIELFKKCIEAFKNSKEFQIILSIGQNNNTEDLGEIPEHIHAYKHVPQLQVLKITDIFITQGGLNSINEAILIKNLPFIVIPQGFDQLGNAKQLEKLGAAIILKNDNVNEEILKNAVNKIIENEEQYKNQVKKISQSFKETRAERKKIYEKIFV